MPYKLKEDFIIPAGTLFHAPPTDTEWFVPVFEGSVAFGNDHTGYLTVDEDVLKGAAETLDLFEWVD